MEVPVLKLLSRPASPLRRVGETSCWMPIPQNLSRAEAVLLSPFRFGKKVKEKKGSMTTQVLDRIRRWSSDRDGLWAEVLARADCRKRVCEGKGFGRLGGERIRAGNRAGKSNRAPMLRKNPLKKLRLLHFALVTCKRRCVFCKLHL